MTRIIKNAATVFAFLAVLTFFWKVIPTLGGR